jgi:hypothetical protein
MHDMLRQRLLAWSVFPGYVASRVPAEPAVPPAHEFADKTVIYPILAFQHGEHLGPEDVFKLLHVGFGEYIKDPAGSKQTIRHNGVKVRMKFCVISKGVNHHHKAGNTVGRPRHGSKESIS